jgi:hypothetical protein
MLEKENNIEQVITIKPKVIQREGLFVIVRSLVNETFTEDFSVNLRQFIVYNPTSRVIKVSYNTRVSTDDYDFIINATKMFVSPPVNFSTISVLQETFSAARLVPKLYVYKKCYWSPSVYSLT